MSEEQDALLELAVFGREVDHFLSTPVGLYLNQKITEEVNRAMNALRTVDPASAGAVAAAQARALVYSDIANWLRQAIAAGLQAETVLQEPDDGEQSPIASVEGDRFGT
ncbi:MAG: hypothetical protein HRJ53_14250 [Acidobacteria bacterium Pan2503]|uniref:Uncharacterized protein n=1 Tax=Candidatus Acidiferrum panamense TaxID=2741543 RepID=A0A7V8SXC2_9BACT|nr:hypothetical protein [Candidatus Acidoferrum panamensis]